MEEQQIKKNEKHVFRIPILKKIDEEANKDESNKTKQADDLRGKFSEFESKLFQDTINPFEPWQILKEFSYDKQKGFFGFYNAVKQWLSTKNLDKDKKLEQNYNLDKPYALARQVFCKYFSFIKGSEKVKYIIGQGVVQTIDRENFVPNINDFFTEEELIKLGGNEFIKDCYKAIGKELSQDELGQYGLTRPQIQNINSRTSEESKDKNSIKPDLYKRVDNHLSWQIFKDGNIKKLNKEEESMLQEAMRN